MVTDAEVDAALRRAAAVTAPTPQLLSAPSAPAWPVTDSDWTALDSTAPALRAPSRFTCDDVLAAVAQRQWLLHFQPKVSLARGDLTGMEALVRWNHPLHGLVLPDEFIAIVQACGAIDALTDWVLQEAVQQQARWTEQAFPIPMAVNVSIDNLRVEGFAKRAGAVVRQAGVAAHDVTLEVTERGAMSPASAPLDCLFQLRLRKFKLSIDDFGTAQSSLTQLRDVPFTELKIDRAVVEGASHDPAHQPLLKQSIAIAKSLCMVSVAEGVETESEWHMLRMMGCDVAQGFFIGRPMVEAAVPGWINEWEVRRRPLFA